jgi:hypothetical protein
MTDSLDLPPIDAPSPADDRSVLIFLHIPKTAGTTVRTVLDVNFPGPKTLVVHNVFKGAGGFSESVGQDLRDDPPELARVRLVRGHVPFGIVASFQRRLQEPAHARPFTFLRDPADRTISHYFQALAAAQTRGTRLPDTATVQEAVEAGMIIDNLQTRMLSDDALPFGKVDGSTLAQAKRNLARGLTFFGVTERFDESLVLAARHLPLSTPLYTVSQRFNEARPRGSAIPAELAGVAETVNEFDLQLYEYACELFDQRFEEARDLELEIELASLKAAQASGPIDTAASPPKSYDGGKESWERLLKARAELMRARWETGRERQLLSTLRREYEAAEKTLAEVRQRRASLKRTLGATLKEKASLERALRNAQNDPAVPGTQPRQKGDAKKGPGKKAGSAEGVKAKGAAKKAGGAKGARAKGAGKKAGGAKGARAKGAGQKAGGTKRAGKKAKSSVTPAQAGPKSESQVDSSGESSEAAGPNGAAASDG